MKKGDLVVWGTEFAVIDEMDFPSKDSVALLPIDNSETIFVNKRELEDQVMSNVSMEIKVMFRMVRGLHLRLNRLGDV